MGLKEQKQPKTLLEYMGFQDPDLELKSHDDIVSLLSEEKSITKLIRKIAPLELPILDTNETYQYYYPVKIEVEKPLSDNYKKYGFLDIAFSCDFNCLVTDEKGSRKKWWQSDAKLFGFIEVKTRVQSFGSLLREIEYYKDVTQKLKLGTAIIPICVTPTKIPIHIKQCHSFTLEAVQEIIL